MAGGSGSGGGVGKKESARRRSIGRKDDVEWADIGPSPSRPFVMWSGRAFSKYQTDRFFGSTHVNSVPEKSVPVRKKKLGTEGVQIGHGI